MSRRQRLSFEPVEDQRLPHVGVSEAKRTRNSGVDMAPQESFTILPPLVPTIPPPPTAPTPFRLSQPANNRARKTSFVILSESAVQRSESEELRDEWRKAQNKPSRIPRSRPGSRDPSPLQRRLSDTVGSRIPQPLSPARHIKTAGDGGSPKRLAPRTNGVSKRQSLSPLQKRNVINRGRDRNVRGRPTAKERSPTVSRGTSPIREITGRLPEPDTKPEPTEKTGKGRGRANAAVKKPGKPGAKNGKPPLPSKNGAGKVEESKPAGSEPQVVQPTEEPKETETSKPEEQPAKKEEAPVPTEKAKAPTFKPDEVVYVTPTMASPQSTTATATISRAPNLSSTLSGLSAFRNTMATHSSSWKVSSALDKGPNMSASVTGTPAAETTKDGDPPSIITTPPTSGKAGTRGMNLSSVASGVSAFKTGTPPSSSKHPRSPKLSSVAENRANSPRSGRTVLSSAAAGVSAFRAPSPKAGRSSPHLSSAATGVSAFRTNSPKLSSNRLGNLSSTTHGITAFRNQLSGKQQQQQQQQREGSAAAKQFSKNMVTCSVASSFKAAASGLPPVDSPSPVLEEPPAVESTATLVESTTEVAVATTALPDEKHTLSGITSAKAAFLAGRQTPTPQPESNGALTTTDTVLKEDPEIESLSANRLRSGKARAMAFLRPRIDSPSGKTQEAGETKHGLCYRVLCVPWKRVGGLPCCQKCKKVCACCDRLNCDRCKCCKKSKGRATCCHKGNCCGKPTCCGKPSACGKGCLAKLNCFAKGRPKGRPSTHCCKKMDCCANMKDCRANMRGACTKERCCPDGYKAGTKKCCKAFVCLPFMCCKKGGCSCKRHKHRTSVGTMASKKTSSVDGAEPEVPKLDPALVEHNSLMRAAIPVLPLPLAWICLFFNVFVPGLGTFCSGLLCLCFGKPRFSVRDDAQGRLGSFFVNLVIAVGQAFTVFFCLVGWGWSIWWGVIMLKLARKNKKLHKAEAEAAAAAATVAADQNHDVERAS